MIDPAEPRPTPQAAFELGQRLARPCANHLDLTVGEIPGPPDHAELLGLPEHEPAEANALYPAPDEPSGCGWAATHGQSALARARCRRTTT